MAKTHAGKSRKDFQEKTEMGKREMGSHQSDVEEACLAVWCKITSHMEQYRIKLMV